MPVENKPTKDKKAEKAPAEKKPQGRQEAVERGRRRCRRQEEEENEEERGDLQDLPCDDRHGSTIGLSNGGKSSRRTNAPGLTDSSLYSLFPDTDGSIVSIHVDSDVMSLDGRHILETEAEIKEDSKLHVTVRKSNASRYDIFSRRPHGGDRRRQERERN